MTSISTCSIFNLVRVINSNKTIWKAAISISSLQTVKNKIKKKLWPQVMSRPKVACALIMRAWPIKWQNLKYSSKDLK